MSVHPFDRFARKFLKRQSQTADGQSHIDVRALRVELARYDTETRERLRRAALQAIEDELAQIQSEREGDPPC